MELTQEKLDEFAEHTKKHNPKLHQFIIDFFDKKVTHEEVIDFQAMTKEEQQEFLEKYEARG